MSGSRPAGDGERSPVAAWRRRGLWVAALLPALLLSIWHRNDGPGPSEDDHTHFLLHARALAEGRPYTDIEYIYTDLNPFIGPPAQPPATAVSLLPVVALWGAHPLAIRALMVGFMLTFVVLASLHLTRQKPALGPLLALVSSVALELAQTTDLANSDLGFAAVLWGVFLLADTERPWGVARMAAVAALGALAFGFRLAALPLIPALGLWGLLHFRTQRLRTLVPLVTWAATLTAMVALLPVLATVRQGPGGRSASMLASPAIANLAKLQYGVFEIQLYPFSLDAANDVYHVLATVIMVVGLALWVRRRARDLPVAFSAFYFAMLFARPGGSGRYLWPLFPLLAFGLITGATELVGRWVPEPRLALARRAVGSTLAALLALAVANDARRPRPEALLDQPALRDVVAWLGDRSSREPVRVVFRKPRTLAWATRLPVMGQVAWTPEVALAELDEKRITHVVIARLKALGQGSRFHRLVEGRPDLFEREFASGEYTVYRYRRAPTPTLSER